MKQAGIARELGVSRAIVSRWKKKLEAGGVEALRKRKAPGRPPGLDERQKQALIEKLKAGAQAAGFANEQWTQKRVRQVIEQEFGVHYHRNYIGRLLKELGWSVQKIEPRARERDEELIRAWLERDWPRIKKRGGSAHRSCLKMNLGCPSFGFVRAPLVAAFEDANGILSVITGACHKLIQDLSSLPFPGFQVRVVEPLRTARVCFVGSAYAPPTALGYCWKVTSFLRQRYFTK